MPFSGLDDFIKVLESKGQLVRIKEFVEPIYEIAEITDRISKQQGGGKALLFENTGKSFPVLTNAFGSDERISLALGIFDPDAAAARIDELFKHFTQPRQSLASKLKILPTLKRVAKWLPHKVSGKGECQEVVHRDPDLNIIPILKCWPHDGERFITLPMVITKDPKTGIRNVGMYRMQVFGNSLTGMHWHRHKTGARHFNEYKKLGIQMPIAVAIGGDPVYTYAATAPLPDNIDEFLLAGFLRNRRVKLVKGITVDIEVPYDADFVIEGYVDPSEDLAWEGPFGDHTGFYSLADWYPKFHITCITHKRNAIYPATIVGVPPMEDKYMARATERIFLSPIKIAMLPEVVDMNLPEEGVAHNIAIVKIDKSYPGQAYKVGSALWGAGQMMFNKIMVIVDSDVDIHCIKDVARAITKNYSPLYDTLISRGPLDVLDHSSSKPAIGGKFLIDATEKLNEELNSEVEPIVIDTVVVTEHLKLIFDELSDFNLSLLNEGISLILVSIDKSSGAIVRMVAQSIACKLGKDLPKIIVIVDKHIPLEKIPIVTWYTAGNVDPERDCFYAEVDGVKAPCLFIDGTRKTLENDNFKRDWPNIVTSSMQTVKEVDSKWNRLGLGNFIESPSIRFLDIVQQDSAIAK
ncbi:MAG: menaquinone biosynthesis decarboxylase [Bacteroidales bacterium]|jgi:4-hydroxy-3-polyprenylbenzoate decarboxylase|nr:menaquinone biosynthesis decarboxylase [Bacteroidales bacterium]MDD4384838.1 menaquinone biosynthesis decarboxylase [Bacteroidales bacterium]MDY0196698.1 menaquinone biosynthesis decarboxylase [Tenuifilaceae bacterium]